MYKSLACVKDVETILKKDNYYHFVFYKNNQYKIVFDIDRNDSNIITLDFLEKTLLPTLKTDLNTFFSPHLINNI